jgi:hypothetical protein
MCSTVARARCPRAEQVLGNADLVGLVTSMIKDDAADDRGPAPRAALSLCLASASVRAAVLASVQRVRMDRPLPVLRLMASLASLRVGRGSPNPYQLPHLITDQQLPVYLGQLITLSSLDLSGCGRLQQLPDTIGQLTGLASLCLRNCGRLQQLPDSIRQLTALSSLDLGHCHSMQQLPDTISQLISLSSLNLGGCRSLQQLPDIISQLTALSSLNLRSCRSLQQLPDTIGQLSALSSLDLSWCYSLQHRPADSPQQPGPERLQ